MFKQRKTSIQIGYQIKVILIFKRKEGKVLFSDALTTFYLRLYGVRHMVKDHSDSEIENPLPPHGYSFQLTTRVLLYASFTDRIIHITAFVTPVVEHWPE